MKDTYEPLDMEIELFEGVDVIVTSDKDTVPKQNL